ncbi:hypothetical protein IWW36_004765, partial [Coemansia brasiliensis]
MAAGTRGGTLSAQVAHVQYLGLCANTDHVCNWTADYLKTHVLVWAQHVDLSWATLAESEQKDVQLHTRYLLSCARESSKLLASRWFRQKLARLHPGGCHLEILKSIVANAKTPHELRIAAIQQLLLVDCSPSQMQLVQMAVEAEKQADGREIWAIEELTEQLRSRIAHSPKDDLVEMEQLKAQQEMITAMKNAWFPPCLSQMQAVDSNAQVISQIFARKQPALCNGIVMAALEASSHHSDSIWFARVEEYLSKGISQMQTHICSLDARVMAKLTVHSKPVCDAYLEALLQLSFQLQQSMLNEETVQVDDLVEHWEQLFLVNSLAVKQALRESQKRFDSLVEVGCKNSSIAL